MDWDAVRRKIEAKKPAAVPAALLKTPEEAIHKAPEERTAEDVQALVDYVGGLHVSFIDDYFPEEDRASVLEAACRALKFETADPESVVFSKGDVSDKFYIIIRGSVSVWVAKEDNGEYPTAANLTKRSLLNNQSTILTPSIDRLAVDKRRSHRATLGNRRRSGTRLVVNPVADAPEMVAVRPGSPKRGSSSSASSAGEGGEPGAGDGVGTTSPLMRQASLRRGSDGSRRKRVSVNPGGRAAASEDEEAAIRTITDKVDRGDSETFVGFMRPGGPTGSFGELGLVSESSSRTATVRTGTQGAEFLTLDRESFDRVLREKFVAALDAKVETMKRFALFEGISDSHLRILALHVQKRTYKAGEVIFRAGQAASSLLCLVDGACEMALARDKPGAAPVSRRTSLRERPEVVYTRVAVVPAGAVVGHKEALATPQQHFSHCVRAVDDVSALQIDREAYVSRVRQDLWRQA